MTPQQIVEILQSKPAHEAAQIVIAALGWADDNLVTNPLLKLALGGLVHSLQQVTPPAGDTP